MGLFKTWLKTKAPLTGDETKVFVLFIHPTGAEMTTGTLTQENKLKFSFKGKELEYIFNHVPQATKVFGTDMKLFQCYSDEKIARELTPKNLHHLKTNKNQPLREYAVLTNEMDFQRTEGRKDAAKPLETGKEKLILYGLLLAIVIILLANTWFIVSQQEIIRQLATGGIEGASKLIPGG